MKLKELQQKIDRRTALKETLDLAEDDFKTLEVDIQEYGDDVVMEALQFSGPNEKYVFHVVDMPRIPARPFVKAIGEALDILRKEIKNIEDELKGIVEFED